MSFTLTMPKLSPTMEVGTIAKWHKREGDFVAAGELLVEIATDKATVEHQAVDEGYLRRLLIPEGGEAAVNQPIALFTETADEPVDEPLDQVLEEVAVKREEDPKLPPSPTYTATRETPTLRIKASPLAKKLAEQQGIDLSTVIGTGPGGRIVSRDLTQTNKRGGEEPLSPIRKVIATRLQEAKSTIPHFYVTVEVDAEPLVLLREQLSHFEHKVSFNDLILKATALTLKSHPGINSGFQAKNSTILRFATIDLSVAVQVESGLITPIITDADKKTVEEISKEVRALAKKAKEGKLLPVEFQGGSFTVSNLGMYGVTQFQAIINPPQAAILAVGAILDRPTVKQGQIVPGKTLTLTLSVDHRVIDGVAAALFLQSLKTALENPASLIV